MKNKIIFLIIFFVVISSRSYCQNDFRSGFIITSENDTIKTQVAYRSNLKNYKSCLCKGEQGEIEYLPNQIKGFGYDNDKFFSSQISKDSFVEALVSGKISLYKSKNTYYLKKDTSLYTLEPAFEEVEKDGRVSVKENKSWRGITSFLISDCITDPQNVVAGTNQEEKSLTKLIVKYNKCTGSEVAEYKAHKPWIKYEFGATVGLSKTDIQITKKKRYVAYLKDSYSSYDPTFGVLINIASPRISERFSFQSEIQFIKSNYSSLIEINNPTKEIHDTYINLTTLSVPLSLKYSFPEKKYGWYLQGGIDGEYHLNAETKVLSEYIVADVVTTYPERPAFNINKNQFGFWGGVGILKSYQKFKASIAVRYFRMSAMHKYGGYYNVNDNRISLNLILLKK